MAAQQVADAAVNCAASDADDAAQSEFDSAIAACRCGPPPEDCVLGDSVLTQQAWGAGKFRNAPRLERELGVSALIGEWSAEGATRYVLMGQSPTTKQLSRAVVRLTTVGKLRSAGFAVVHTPARVLRGAHVTVVWPDDDPLNRPDAAWPHEVSEQFDSCFNEGGGGGQNEP